MFFSTDKENLKSSIFHFDKSGKDDNKEQPSNILLYSFKLIVFHIEISGILYNFFHS